MCVKHEQSIEFGEKPLQCVNCGCKTFAVKQHMGNGVVRWTFTCQNCGKEEVYYYEPEPEVE